MNSRHPVRVSSIRFTQNSANYNFSGNYNLDDLLNDLKRGTKTVEGFTRGNRLQVFEKYGVLYSCNNRRLCVFKEFDNYLKNRYPNAPRVMAYVDLVDLDGCPHKITCIGIECDRINIRDSPGGRYKSCPSENYDNMERRRNESSDEEIKKKSKKKASKKKTKIQPLKRIAHFTGPRVDTKTPKNLFYPHWDSDSESDISDDWNFDS
jgi:hypothetical protein